LGDLRAAERFGIATRIHPGNFHSHEPENLKRVFKESLARLKTGKVKILFLVTRDSATPIESTLSAVQELHDEGLFEEFGVSNFSAWQVAEASEIAARRGWIRPSVYQGLYNAITRAVEPELFKCLGNYGIRFHAYNPLAGGAFSKSFGASCKSARHKTHHPVLSLFSPCIRRDSRAAGTRARRQFRRSAGGVRHGRGALARGVDRASAMVGTSARSHTTATSTTLRCASLIFVR
jgi:aryl-alcohol dehydrogenase-like predicted oxidoreductase